MNEALVIVRGAGDIATGTISRLAACGFRVAALEAERPTAIRRTVAFAQAVFDGACTVEGLEAVRVGSEAVEAGNLDEIAGLMGLGKIPVIVDPAGKVIDMLKPGVVVDAILAKRNMGTHKGMAPVVIALGPGFTAGEDVHAVVETNRGHNLGRVTYQGCAEPDTGTPGLIAGFGRERIIRSPAAGCIKASASIGDNVNAGDIVAYVGEAPVKAPIEGVLRGLIQQGIFVPEGYKIGDVDPRAIKEHCFTISDKARAIAGGVLEAILHLGGKGLL